MMIFRIIFCILFVSCSISFAWYLNTSKYSTKHPHKNLVKIFKSDTLCKKEMCIILLDEYFQKIRKITNCLSNPNCKIQKIADSVSIEQLHHELRQINSDLINLDNTDGSIDRAKTFNYFSFLTNEFDVNTINLYLPSKKEYKQFKVAIVFSDYTKDTVQYTLKESKEAVELLKVEGLKNTIHGIEASVEK